MSRTRVIAAAAALVVSGAALAATPTDNGGTTSLGASTDMTYTLARTAGDSFGIDTLTPVNSTNKTALQAHAADLGTLWILSDLSYELPGHGTTIELGFGWYGLGGGFNFYPQGGRSGLMFSARAGWTGSGGVAVNGAVNYVGHFNPTVAWRLGIGVEYQSNSGWLNGWTNVFPIGIADVGFRF